ncbi:MBL fold metallo-hydrolase [Methanobacterium sp. ACI-7]|uniref:MBL fold metallo-hydrolase n=1 Tax=unclassified Methanobacterium TaxID=2627676 RepID=UPI0039C1CB5B
MQIIENVHAIKIPFQVKTDSGILERFVYSYLITGKQICLIDSGVISSEGVIFDYMEKIGLKSGDISLMILTHSHPDHIGSAKSIKEKSNCKVAAHLGEKSWIENIDLQAKERPVPNFHSLVEGSVDVDEIIEDRDIINLGNEIILKVIHTPGHSKGSISLLIEREGVLITGDVIPIKGDLPIYDDPNESIQSIKKLREIEGINVLLSAWDEPKEGNDTYKVIDEGINYLKQIQLSVDKISNENSNLDTLKFCKMVLKDLGIPEIAANPIVARSFQSNLKNINLAK